jgi:hypothetical protein
MSLSDDWKKKYKDYGKYNVGHRIAEDDLRQDWELEILEDPISMPVAIHERIAKRAKRNVEDWRMTFPIKGSDRLHEYSDYRRIEDGKDSVLSHLVTLEECGLAAEEYAAQPQDSPAAEFHQRFIAISNRVLRETDWTAEKPEKKKGTRGKQKACCSLKDVMERYDDLVAAGYWPKSVAELQELLTSKGLKFVPGFEGQGVYLNLRCPVCERKKQIGIVLKNGQWRSKCFYSFEEEQVRKPCWSRIKTPNRRANRMKHGYETFMAVIETALQA